MNIPITLGGAGHLLEAKPGLGLLFIIHITTLWGHHVDGSNLIGWNRDTNEWEVITDISVPNGDMLLKNGEPIDTRKNYTTKEVTI